MATKTYKKGTAVRLSNHFNSTEFDCHGSGCCTETKINDDLVSILEKIRVFFDRPITVTSGYRCDKHNSTVGGATGSRHTKGDAADIVVSGIAPAIVAAYAEYIGVHGIGLYETASDGFFVHVDTRESKSFWYGQAQASRSTFGGWDVCKTYQKTATATEAASEAKSGTSASDTVLFSGKVYNCTQVRIRSGAGLSYSVVGYAAKYTTHSFYDTKVVGSATWGRMEKGWICLDYIRKVSDTETDTSDTAVDTSGDYAEATYDDSPDWLWNYFMGQIGNAYGVAGLLGNLNAESNLIAANLQISYRTKLGHSSKSYTDAVDKGTYAKFSTDCAGYGLAQWTDSSRKTKLLSFAREKKASIGNRQMQAEFLMKELNGSFASVLTILKYATSVQTASNAVLMRFECPADQGGSVQATRASFGQNYYNRFADTGNSSVQTTTSTGYSCTVTASVLNVRSGPGTNYSRTTVLRKDSVQKIVEEQGGWGKLASGLGWICLDYITKA